MLSHGIPSRLDGVNGASPPLSFEYAWTGYTSKHHPKFFDNLKIDGRGTKHSSNAAAAACILLLFFLDTASKNFEPRDV